MNQIQQNLLAIMRCQLVGGKAPQLNLTEIIDVLKEAEDQTVFSSAFPFLQGELKKLDQAELIKQKKRYSWCVIINTANFLENSELDALMTESGIPYSTIKGLASAYYYPDPTLRDMGDVDFIVAPKDFERAKQAVLKAGFFIHHGEDDGDMHIAFHRMKYSVWELHRNYTVPPGEIGERIQKEIDSIIETSELITVESAACRIPDAFHHGLIMLLHVASHMTNEGVSLRHLCDWAVFADKLGNDEFISIFKRKLTSFGLWKFAQILTLVSEKYLGINKKEWAQNPHITDEYIENLMDDIMSGGNFGRKDMNRYREIKYISNRGEHKVDDKNVVSQLFSTLNQKTYTDYSWIEKRRVFLPIGWVAEGGKYLGLLISGKRKSSGTSAMLKEASKRKSLYSQMELFEA